MTKKAKLLKAQKAGGKAVKEKYGIEHFRELGRRAMAKRWGVYKRPVLASK